MNKGSYILAWRDLAKPGETGLKEWLALPFAPIPEDVLDYYHFERWVKRFV